jgi:hypothetical protein
MSESIFPNRPLATDDFIETSVLANRPLATGDLTWHPIRSSLMNELGLAGGSDNADE